MIKIIAKIRLRTAGEGGMNKSGFSGMQPSFRLNDDLIICRVFRLDGGDIIQQGEYHDVLIELPYGERYAPFFIESRGFELNIGSQIIGEGTIVSISKQ